MKTAVFTVWIPVKDDDESIDALLDKMFELEKSEGWIEFELVDVVS